jgi:hypothetical protein
VVLGIAAHVLYRYRNLKKIPDLFYLLRRRLAASNVYGIGSKSCV